MPTHKNVDSLPTYGLDQLVHLVGRSGGQDLYLRWSRGPADDRVSVAAQRSRDALTGVTLPGLSASPLAIEHWWNDRSVRFWVARRVADYVHLRHRRGPGVRPWLFEGDETGRGPDNEPLVVCRLPIAWVSEEAVVECTRIIELARGADEWGPLARGEG